MKCIFGYVNFWWEYFHLCEHFGWFRITFPFESIIPDYRAHSSGISQRDGSGSVSLLFYGRGSEVQGLFPETGGTSGA